MKISRLTCAALAVVVLLSLMSCDDDDGPVEPPEYECLSQRKGEVLGDHVHGGAVICGIDALLEVGERQQIDVTEGETQHVHFFSVTGEDARKVFEGQQVFKTTSPIGSSHQHDVIFNRIVVP